MKVYDETLSLLNSKIEFLYTAMLLLESVSNWMSREISDDLKLLIQNS